DDATPVVTTVDMGMLKMTMYLADKQAALAGGAPPEMFLDTLIRMTGRIPAGASELKLRLTLPPEGPGKLPTLPDTGMQRFKRLSEREGTLTIQRLDWKAIRAARDADDTPELKEYLRSSSVLDIQ